MTIINGSRDNALRDEAGRELEATPNGRLMFNSNAAMLAAAVAGQGLIHVPAYVTAAALREGALVSLLEDHVLHRGTVHALWPSTRQLAPKVRAFVEFLSIEFGRLERAP